MAEIERPLLSEEAVRAAEKREGDYANHPVILALDRHKIEIARFVDGYFEIKDFQPGETRTKDGYLKASSDFLIEAITVAGSYTLEPLELVAIWSRVMELFPDDPSDMSYPPLHRHALAGIISTSYAVSGLDNTKWLDFPMTHLRDLELPAEVLQDRDGALRVFNRLEEIRLNLLEVEYYKWGSRIDFGLLMNIALGGDSEVESELLSRSEGFNKRNTPVLSQLHENFSNGMMYAHYLVGRLV